MVRVPFIALATLFIASALLCCPAIPRAEAQAICPESISYYSRSSPLHQSRKRVNPPSGGSYLLFLAPDWSVDGSAPVLDLVLRPVRSQRADENLLQSKGNWHGPQAYTFLASDFSSFAKHPEAEPRTLRVTEAGLLMTVSVREVQLERPLQSGKSPLKASFQKLVVAVECKPLNTP